MGGGELTVVPGSIWKKVDGSNKQPHDRGDDKAGKKGSRKKRKKVKGLASLEPTDWLNFSIKCNNFSLDDHSHTQVTLRDGHTSRVRIDVVAQTSGAFDGFLHSDRIQYYKASTTIKFNESVVDTNTTISHVERDTVRIMALKMPPPDHIDETEWLPNIPEDPLGDHTAFNV